MSTDRIVNGSPPKAWSRAAAWSFALSGFLLALSVTCGLHDLLVSPGYQWSAGSIAVILWPVWLVAIALGVSSLADIRQSRGRLRGRGLAVGGIAMGLAGLVMVAVLLVQAVMELDRTFTGVYRQPSVSEVQKVTGISLPASARVVGSGMRCGKETDLIARIEIDRADRGALVSTLKSKGFHLSRKERSIDRRDAPPNLLVRHEKGWWQPGTERDFISGSLSPGMESVDILIEFGSDAQLDTVYVRYWRN